MEHKQAAEILMKMLKKGNLSAEEKEALSAALGVLAWTQLSASRMKNIKAKREKDKRL